MTRRSTARVVTVCVVTTACVAAGCSGAAPPPADSTYPTGAASGAPLRVEPLPVTGTRLSLAVAGDARAGRFITDGEGRALYRAVERTPGSHRCDSACAAEWPPVLLEGFPRITAPEIEQAMLGTATRPGGVVQLTYRGAPLHYYAGDTIAGTAKGEGVTAHGARWRLVVPAPASLR